MSVHSEYDIQGSLSSAQRDLKRFGKTSTTADETGARISRGSVIIYTREYAMSLRSTVTYLDRLNKRAVERNVSFNGVAVDHVPQQDC